VPTKRDQLTNQTVRFCIVPRVILVLIVREAPHTHRGCRCPRARTLGARSAAVLEGGSRHAHGPDP
jgi:hypothetical protein